jgi:hypothetical protein
MKNKPDSKENFIRVYQQMLKDEDRQTDLLDLIQEENREVKDSLQFMGLELVDGEVRKKK